MKKIYLTLLFSFVLISCDYTTSKELPVTEEEVLGVFNCLMRSTMILIAIRTT